jgi:hypothetical protein
MEIPSIIPQKFEIYQYLGMIILVFVSSRKHELVRKEIYCLKISINFHLYFGKRGLQREILLNDLNILTRQDNNGNDFGIKSIYLKLYEIQIILRFSS